MLIEKQGLKPNLVIVVADIVNVPCFPRGSINYEATLKLKENKILGGNENV